MYKVFVDRVIDKLELDNIRYNSIFGFLRTVSYYKITPYIDFVADNPELRTKLPENKDNWDMVVSLYRYNIKLSIALYPYVYLLENTLKTQINNEMTKYFGYDWYKNIEPTRTGKSANTVDYIISVKNKFLMNNKQERSLGNFVENNATMGYWIALLQTPEFWDSKNIKLKRLFVNDDTLYLNQVKTNEIYNKLTSVNDLRNGIAHHNQIIGKKLISKRTKYEYGLWEVYENINYLLKHLGCEDIDKMTGDLYCKEQEYCAGNSFEVLYKEMAFIHNCEIKARPTNEKCLEGQK